MWSSWSEATSPISKARYLIQTSPNPFPPPPAATSDHGMFEFLSIVSDMTTSNRLEHSHRLPTSTAAVDQAAGMLMVRALKISLQTVLVARGLPPSILARWHSILANPTIPSVINLPRVDQHWRTHPPPRSELNTTSCTLAS